MAALAAAVAPAAPVGLAVAAAVGPAVTAAVGPAVAAAVGPAVTAAVGPAVAAAVVGALAPLEAKIARLHNQSSLSQGLANAPLMPLPELVTGAVPNAFPATKYEFDSLNQPPLTQVKLDESYR